MYDTSLNSGLSKYQRVILNKIIAYLEINKDFNISDLVKKIVSQRTDLENQNELVSETGYLLKEYLLAEGLAIEKEEITVYLLTEKGSQLVACHTIEQLEKKELRKNKRTFIHKLFYGDQSRNKILLPEDMISHYE